MAQDRFINRKSFIRLASMVFVAAFLAAWNLISRKQKDFFERPVETRINTAKLGTGIFLFDTFILVKSDDSLKIFSNKCTHAGCRINQEMDGQLICPCHGSRFEAKTGKVIKGPAGLPLLSIPFNLDSKTGEIVIKI